LRFFLNICYNKSIVKMEGGEIG